MNLLFDKNKDTEEIEKKIGIQNLGNNIFEIQDISFQTFFMILNFIYCNKIDKFYTLDIDKLTELQQLSDSFQIPNLKKIIISIIQTLNSKEKNKIEEINSQIKEIYQLEFVQLLNQVKKYYSNDQKHNFDLEILLKNPKNKKKQNQSLFTFKSLLIARTSNFKKLLIGQQEKNRTENDYEDDEDDDQQNKRSQLILYKFNNTIITDFLLFLKTNRIIIKNYEHSLQLLKLSLFFGQETLNILCQISICDEFMIKLSPPKLAKLYLTLKKLNLKQLLELCIILIKSKYEKIIKTKIFKNKFSEEDKQDLLTKTINVIHFHQKYKLFHKNIKRKFDLEQDEEKLIDFSYKIWKKNCVFLYDLVLTHALKWPSLSVQWLPTKNKQQGNGYSEQYLIIGTHTSGMEQNYLMVASVKLPTDEENVESQEYNEELDLSGYGTSVETRIEIIKKIPHPTEVNKARYMTQRPNIIATKTASSDVLIFDSSQEKEEESNGPLITCSGHSQEGYGLSWNNSVEGHLLSGSDDSLVCYYDINGGTMSEGKMNPVQTMNFHTQSIEDVSWQPVKEWIFGSVGDDKMLVIGDIRQPNQPTHKIVAHEAEVNSIAFNPFSEFILATGSSDNTISLWDLRNMKNRIHSFVNHTDSVYGLQWNPFNETILASSANDRRIEIWDLSKIGQEQTEEDAKEGPPELLFIHGGHTSRISDFSWSQNEPWVLSSTADDNIIQVWQMAESIYNDDF
ncbi:histone-binding protein msi1 [Anaeramoeba flamelloides]|uniref:Histone-binding protein msi1 n=1 Tax=Anaeramoeba flamelloides TaxID=1746091 RepID=A0AAV7YWS3_9EUKA|nr:histone-binding protein msi1 [Anaeramoeba flamelloides]